MYEPCPDYPGQTFHSTGGYCSCGGNHRYLSTFEES